RNTNVLRILKLSNELLAVILIFVLGLAPRTRWLDNGFGSERNQKYVIHMLDGDDLQFGLCRFRQVNQILEILLGQNDGLQPGTMRGQYFLTNAADRQNPSTQGDLSGHANMTIYRAPRQSGNDRGGHRNPRGRAILREATF